MSNPVLIIGIDGGTWDVLKPAMDAGCMPNLSNIVSQGASSPLSSVIPAITPAAWGSFQTGRNPGQNGVYDFKYWDQLGQRQLVSSDKLKNTIWEIASTAGKRVGVLNVPMTYPPRKINGEMICGLLTPGLSSNFTWPTELKDELINAVPDYDILNLSNVAVSPTELPLDEFLTTMNLNLDHRLKAGLHLINSRSYDLFMIHYHASDIVQHGLWGFLDPSHKLFSPEKQKLIFEKFYAHLDENIGKTIEAFKNRMGQNTFTILMSDHGFQANVNQVNMSKWLIDNGYLPKPQKAKKRNPAVMFAKKIGLGKIAKIFIPQKKVAKIEQQLNLKQEQPQHKILYSGGCREGFLTIIEQDQQKKSELITEIIGKLKTLQHNGQNIFAQIYRKEDIFHGDNLDTMPDITMVPIDKWSSVFNESSDNLFIETDIETTIHVGTHHQDGIFAITGPGVKSGPTQTNNILDITPTVLWLLGISVTDSRFDGKILHHIFENSDFLNATENISVSITNNEIQKDSFTKSETDDVEQRLKDLGYM